MLATHEQNVTAFAYGLEPEIYDNFKMAEQLAHRIAYEPLKTNAIVNVYIAGSQREVPHSIYQFTVDHAGLVGYVLCPVDFLPSHGNSVDIKVLFKGTSDFASLQRDLTEQGGPGHESFHANKKKMIRQLNDVIRYCKENLAGPELDVDQLKFSVTFFGHSLGGGDAQRMMLAAKEAIFQNLRASERTSPRIISPEDVIVEAHRDQLKAVVKLSLYTFNATGVSHRDNRKAERLAGFITHQRRQSDLKLALELNMFNADGDGIQQFGNTYLLSRTSRENATVRFVKATNNHRGLNFITEREARETLQNVGHSIVRNYFQGAMTVSIAGAVSFVAAYALGLTPLAGSGIVAGGTALLSAGMTTVNGWYRKFKNAKLVASVVAGAYGTLITHRMFYFTPEGDHHQAMRDHLDLYFLSASNKDAAEQKLIMEEVQTRSIPANVAHQGYARAHSTVCRSIKPVTQYCSKRSTESSESSTQRIHWLYRPNPAGLKQFQREHRIIREQVANAHANAVVDSVVERGSAVGYF